MRIMLVKSLDHEHVSQTQNNGKAASTAGSIQEELKQMFPF